MKKTVKIIIALVTAIIIAAAAISSALAPLKLEIVVLNPETASITFTEQGTYTYEKKYMVYPLVSGEILEVLASVGQKVGKGEPIAVISASDFDYQIEKLQSGIESYKAQISGLKEQENKEKDALSGERQSLLGQIAALEAQISGRKQGNVSIERQISFQEDVVESARKLVSDFRAIVWEARSYNDEDAVNAAQIQLAQAEQALAGSKVALEQLQGGIIPEGYYEGQLQSLNSQLDAIDSRINKSYSSSMESYYNSLIEEAESGIRQLREKQGQAIVTAPAGGVITELNIENSNVISQQSAVGAIGWNECIEVYVATRELDSIAVGGKVGLKRYKRQGDEISAGTIVSIGDKAEIRTSALGVEESKVRVRIRPDNEKPMVGEHVDVIFTVFSQEEALVVPKTAVFSFDGADTVWTVRDGAAYKQTIEKGMETRNGYIINAGLNAGDSVIKDADVQGLADRKKISAP